MKQLFNKIFKSKTTDNQIAAQIQAKLQQALMLHRNGQAAQAQILFEEIIKIQPEHRIQIGPADIAS